MYNQILSIDSSTEIFVTYVELSILRSCRVTVHTLWDLVGMHVQLVKLYKHRTHTHAHSTGSTELWQKEDCLT